MLYVYIYIHIPLNSYQKSDSILFQVTIWNLPQKSSQLPHEAPEKSVGLEVSGWWRPAQGRGTSQWDPSPSRRSWPLTAGGKLRWSEKHGKTMGKPMGKCGKMWEDCGNYGKNARKKWRLSCNKWRFFSAAKPFGFDDESNELSQ